VTAARLAAGVLLAASVSVLGAGSLAAQQASERAHELGIPLDGTPGPLDAITDVRGVTVGHATIVRGAGRLTPGKGPVRTGVTAILPRGRDDMSPVFAGWFSLNGNGEMTGTAWVDDYALLFYPIAITNTNSVGTVRDALIEWGAARLDPLHCCLPVVAETWDGDLNDIFGFHVTKAHVFEAIAAARAGPVPEGNVGGGTGMQCLGFKGGIGTASRRLPEKAGGFTMGALVQCNFGLRNQLRIAGIPVGRELQVEQPCYDTREPLDSTLAPDRCARVTGDGSGAAPRQTEHGSIIVVLATDAPLLPHQLKSIARRAALGVGRMGGISGAGSGDLFLAFSTAPTGTADRRGVASVQMLSDDVIDPVYEAAVQATEEAIINAMLAARTMTGANWYRVPALPHDGVREALRRHGRLLGK